MIVFNVESDEAKDVGAQLINQLYRMRKAVEERLFDLCACRPRYHQES